MPGLILASTSDNAPGGAVLTFAFPVILFAVIAVILYLLFSRPHRRIPSRRVVMASASAGASAVHSTAADAGETTSGSVSGETGENSGPSGNTEASE